MSGFHVMAKPSGSACNLDCKYCFYLEKARLYPEAPAVPRMTRSTLEAYIQQTIAAHPRGEIPFAWQGGEPTLMGLSFFEDVVALQRAHGAGGRASNVLQTNGVLLDARWAGFFQEHGFRVGLSIDGPRGLHDRYRVRRGGSGSFDEAVRAFRLLQDHGVTVHTLTTVHAGNQHAGGEVYAFLRDLGSRLLQFIPIVERQAAAPDATGLRLPAPDQGPAPLAPWSVDGAAYGAFLIEIFDRWIREDVGRVGVQMFETALAAWMGLPATHCVFAETCGRALALEHQGDVYACDHYVYPEHRLGNLHDTPIGALVGSPAQRAFGRAKRDTLPSACRRCTWRFACNGGCPKHRLVDVGEGGRRLNHLCAGYTAFFAHADPWLRQLAAALRAGQSGEAFMAGLPASGAPTAGPPQARNAPCRCGSGRKAKKCCDRPGAGGQA